MVAQPGTPQNVFTSGEIAATLHERDDLKYFRSGCSRAQNVEFLPHGGFRNRAGTGREGLLINASQGTRSFPFTASNGVAYDLVFMAGSFHAFRAGQLVESVTMDELKAIHLKDLTHAQLQDTMLLFNQNLEPLRVKFDGTNFSYDIAPFRNLPNYDYGGTYTNGQAAIWRLQFDGLTSNSTLFTLTVNGEESKAILYSSSMATLGPLVASTLNDMPIVNAGLTVGEPGNDLLDVVFSGEGNEGDGWSLSAKAVNKTDAAVVSSKTREGVLGGEPVISAERGWPACGAFNAQRLLLGGFRSLGTYWLASEQGDYYNFDDRVSEANGAMLVPMDAPGGHIIRHIVPAQHVQILTEEAEYWLAERAISKTEPPNHVQSSKNGTVSGVPTVENEGTTVFAGKNGGVLFENRYTDVSGNYDAGDISILASHLFNNVADMALLPARSSDDGNLLMVVNSDGQASVGTLLRKQEVTAFSRYTTNGTIKSVASNGDDSISSVVERQEKVFVERRDDSLLLDNTRSFEFATPTNLISGLSELQGFDVWCLADGRVFGPFAVGASHTITLPIAVSAASVGLWSAPLVKTLPLPERIDEFTVIKRPRRIHTVHLALNDTTSIALAVNDQPPKDVDLAHYGFAANQKELEAGYTGTITVRGLEGYRERPTVTITQVRPGRLTVNSITIEAS